MGEFSKEEMKKIKIKEDTNRANAIAASKIHDAAVIENLKNKIGLGQASAPQVTPQPAPPMPQGAPTPMKKGGTASSRADGCAIRGKTRA